jgi:hypothetical protein
LTGVDGLAEAPKRRRPMPFDYLHPDENEAFVAAVFRGRQRT